MATPHRKAAVAAQTKALRGLKEVLSSRRTPTLVIAPVRQHLQEQALLEPPRTTNVLHPSEISQSGWCPRAAYYKILNPPAPEAVSFRQRSIFEYGHAAHERWQGYLAQMGELEGYWHCLVCASNFYWQGKPVCGVCHSTAVQYKELMLADPDLLIRGHTDGLLFRNNAILEVKTIGEGSVRYYAPQLVETHTHEINGAQVVDLKRLWDSIRRPFSSHLRQGMTYAYLARLRPRMTKVDKVVFLYESKMTQDVKEFVVAYNEALIEPTLAGARAVARAVRGEGPVPACREGDASCTACMALEGAVL